MKRHPKEFVVAITLYLLSGPTWALGGPPSHHEAIVQRPAYSRLALESELRLNKGQKWQVDDAMMLRLRQMEEEVESYRGTGVQDAQKLGKRLRATLNKLVSDCTMHGPAHDELHKWLVPFMENVDALNRESNQAAARKSVLKLKNSFQVFNLYFQ